VHDVSDVFFTIGGHGSKDAGLVEVAADDDVPDGGGETGVDVESLGDVADLGFEASETVDRSAIDFDMPRLRFEESEDEFEKRGFTSAVGSDNADHALPGDAEGDVLEDGFGGVGEGEVVNADDGIFALIVARLGATAWTELNVGDVFGVVIMVGAAFI
jgi:hypothetical protein